MDVNKIDNWDAHWSDYSSSTEKIPSHQLRRKMIYQILKKMTDKSHILDFGSGQGDLLKFIASHFPHCELAGLELSATGVEIASQKVPNAIFIQKNLLERTEDDSLDSLKKLMQFANVGLCIEVLEHLDHPEQLLKNIKYYLKPHGKLIITVPGGIMSHFERSIGHRTHYTKLSLAQLLKDSGYTDFSIKAVGFPFFNIYKWVSVLRGKQLITDVKQQNAKYISSLLSKWVMKLFDVLFKLNLNFIPLGWQLIAIVNVPSK